MRSRRNGLCDAMNERESREERRKLLHIHPLPPAEPTSWSWKDVNEEIEITWRKLDGLKRLHEIIENRERALEGLTPEERECHNIEETIGMLKESRTMSGKITRAQHINDELLKQLQHHDPAFMDPIITGLKKRPARQEKAERAIQRLNSRRTNPPNGKYVLLWERF